MGEKCRSSYRILQHTPEMHLLAAAPGAIEDGKEPVDLGQTPADVIFISAADTELAAMSEARSEISHYNEYDYVIVNDDFDVAVMDMKAILRAERLKEAKQAVKHANMLDCLLAEE